MFKDTIEKHNPNMFDWSNEEAIGFKHLHAKVTMFCKVHKRLEPRKALNYYTGVRCGKCWEELKTSKGTSNPYFKSSHEEFERKVLEVLPNHHLVFTSEFVGQQEYISTECKFHNIKLKDKKAQKYLLGQRLSLLLCTIF